MSGAYQYRYYVLVEWSPGNKALIYYGNNRDKAVEKANFWDERCNVEFIDTWRETPLDRAMHKFDEAIERLR